MSNNSTNTTKKDTVLRTFIVAFLLCVVCSVVVSTAAVMLRPMQQNNKEIDRKSNILAVAGIQHDGTAKSIDQAFEQIETKIVNLQTGEFAKNIDPKTFDAKKAVKDPAQSIKLAPNEDIASIRVKPKYQEVYLIKDNGALKTVILPVHGYGLWSTLYGYLALGDDLNTVQGLTFYSHAETPGLGGEVDNPKWKAGWQGKKIYQGEVGGTPEIHLIKGRVDKAATDSEYKIDGLSGATLTSNGVTHLMQFWLGEQGYAKFLQNMKNGVA